MTEILIILNVAILVEMWYLYQVTHPIPDQSSHRLSSGQRRDFIRTTKQIQSELRNQIARTFVPRALWKSWAVWFVAIVYGWVGLRMTTNTLGPSLGCMSIPFVGDLKLSYMILGGVVVTTTAALAVVASFLRSARVRLALVIPQLIVMVIGAGLELEIIFHHHSSTMVGVIPILYNFPFLTILTIMYVIVLIDHFFPALFSKYWRFSSSAFK